MTEFYEDILYFLNENRDGQYVKILKEIYNRFYSFLNKNDKILCEKISQITDCIIQFIESGGVRKDVVVEYTRFQQEFIKHNDTFYRARYVRKDEPNYNKEGMFHFPLNKKKNSKGRYDDENIVCLYLSKRALSCFYELKLDDGQEMMLSLLKYKGDFLHIPDLRLKSIENFNKMNIESQKEYIVSLPYILACMFINNDSTEYIFPQFIMSFLNSLDDNLQKKYNGNSNKVYTPYIGLCYTSVYFNCDQLNLFDNYVFLAKYPLKTGYSKLLSDMFTISEPIRTNNEDKNNFLDLELQLKNAYEVNS